MMTWFLIVLYFSLFAGIVVGLKQRWSLHWTLTSLLFSVIFVSGFKVFYERWHSVFAAVFWWILPSILVTALFAQEYERPVTEPRHNESVGDVLFGLLLTFLLVALFKQYELGWFLSLTMGYVAFYLLLWLVFFWGNRKAFYLLKIPWVVLSLGALIEEFGVQRELLPFLIAYSAVFVLWLKFDLPKMWRPPRMT